MGSIDSATVESLRPAESDLVDLPEPARPGPTLTGTVAALRDEERW